MNSLFRKYIALLTLCAMVLCLSACAVTANPPVSAETVYATVVGIEKYGHTVLDITTSDFIAGGYALGDIVRVRFGSYESDMPFYDGYYSAPGDVMLRGASAQDNIALCINYGDFARETGLAIGDQVEITMVEKAGMRAFYELCALNYSDNPAEYADAAAFANFRPVTAGSIGSGKLYRSASPIDNTHGRAGYANAFLAEAGVATVLNLADSDADIEAFLEEADFDSDYYRSLYESGKVIALDLNAIFFSDEYAAALVEGLRFLARNDPPYSVHCQEGKDRAGFALMLLEALMGAQLQEIIDDYMRSFYNYYGVDKETEPRRYEMILSTNLLPMLYHVTDTATFEELAQTDLEIAATNYLLRNGMDEKDILTLKEKLR